MSKASPIQNAFNAGELSPTLEGRTDLAKYAAGCSTLENFFPLVPGAARKRSGTRFVKEVKDSTKATRLIPFEFGTDQAYILEFGELYMRAYRNGEPVLETGKNITFATKANPVVVTSPGHGLQNGADVSIASVDGMTNINTPAGPYTVANRKADTFDLTDSETGGTITGTTSGSTTVTISITSHGYSVDDRVSIAGTGIAELDKADTYYAVVSVTTHTFNITTSSDPGATASIGWSREAVDGTAFSTYVSGGVATPMQTITATSTGSAPVVVTIVGHGFLTGDQVKVEGTATPSSPLDDRYWVVTKVNTDTFSLDGSADPGVAYSTGTAKRVATVTTPYPAATVNQLQFAQSADVLYLAHPDYAPRKLIRRNHDAWSVELIDFDFQPFSPTNLDETMTVHCNATSGTSKTLNVFGGSLFTEAMEGGYFRLSEIVGSNHGRWVGQSNMKEYTGSTPGADAESGAEFYYDSNVYRLTAKPGGGKSGSSAPIHTNRDGVVGTDGRWSWLYLHSGDGYVKITDVTSGTVATCDIIKELPDSVTDSPGTFRWAHGAWSGQNGFPRSVTFFQDRLWWAGTAGDPQTLWASKTSEYENHEVVDLDESALIFTINTDHVNVIEWIAAAKVLQIGTAGGEFVLSSAVQSEALTAANVLVERHSTYGSKTTVNPQAVGESILYAQRAGRKLREFVYDDTVSSYVSPDMTVLADHITLGGITRLAYQQEPNRVVWATLGDGQLLGFTFDREQQVTAWHRHTIAGTSAKVESIAVIPHPDGDQDQLWMVVNRTIEGTETRHIEYLESDWVRTGSLPSAFFVDSGLSYSGAAVATLSGLDHLEGETVAILADGATHASKTVTAGAIALDVSASTISVGLAYEATLQTMRLDAGAADGTSQGKTKRFTNVVLRLDQTGSGLYYGATATTADMDELHLRDGNDPMDSPVPLFDGDTEILPWPAGYEKAGRLTLKHTLPQPCTVIAIMPQVVTQDR